MIIEDILNPFVYNIVIVEEHAKIKDEINCFSSITEEETIIFVYIRLVIKFSPIIAHTNFVARIGHLTNRIL